MANGLPIASVGLVQPDAPVSVPAAGGLVQPGTSVQPDSELRRRNAEAKHLRQTNKELQIELEKFRLAEKAKVDKEAADRGEYQILLAAEKAQAARFAAEAQQLRVSNVVLSRLGSRDMTKEQRDDVAARLGSVPLAELDEALVQLEIDRPYLFGSLSLTPEQKAVNPWYGGGLPAFNPPNQSFAGPTSRDDDEIAQREADRRGMSASDWRKQQERRALRAKQRAGK